MPVPGEADEPHRFAAPTDPPSGKRRRVGWLLLGAIAVALLVFGPLVLNAYWMRVLSAVFTIAVVAQGINLMAGYTGYPAFGNVVFFGVGAYATAILMGKAHWSFEIAALAAVFIAAALALTVGPPLLRLRGHYFAIATLGLNEAVREVVANSSALTGGGMGLPLPMPDGGPLLNAMRSYYWLLAVMLAAIWVTFEFDRRRLGLGCRSIRDNEAKAEASGLHTTRYKTVAWMISAAMTSAVGAIHAWSLSYIDPPSVFDMGIAVKAFAILLLGGAGTVLGPVIGAFVIELLANFAWSRFLDWHLATMGIIIIGVIMLFPEGFVSALRRQGWIGQDASPRKQRRGASQ